MRKLFKFPRVEGAKFYNLQSYFYFRKLKSELLEENRDIIDLVVDSGAFSAYTLNKEVTLSGYMDFLDRVKPGDRKYFTLDVVGDKKKTKENFFRMIDEGYKPIPIFTRGDDFEMMGEYYKHSDLVGLGGISGGFSKASSLAKGYIKRCMREAAGRHVHWLGFANKDFMSYYRPHALDSTSWSFAFRKGIFLFYLGQNRWKKFEKKDFSLRPPRWLKELFRIYGEDWRSLEDPNEWVYRAQEDTLIKRVPSKSWLLYSLDVKRTLGTKFYLPTVDQRQLGMIIDAYNFWEAEGLIRRSK